MKTTFISLMILFLGQIAIAGTSSAVLSSQRVQVLGEEINPTSCKLYRKRIEQVLQRGDEAYRAGLKKGRMSLSEINGLMHILQRAGLPLQAGQENILWTLEFDLGPAASALSPQPLNIKLSSPYLEWETQSGFFPDHFQVVMSEDRSSLQVTYKLSYMEACLAPLGFSIVVSDDLGNVIQMATPVNKDLIE